MAACHSGAGLRRRWFYGLSLVAALGVIAVGLLLWQAMALSSLTTVSEAVTEAKPLLSGLRLALIGLLAVVWPRLPSVARSVDVDSPINHARWLTLRWRVVTWLLVIELIVGQNLLGRFVHLVTGTA